MSLTLVRASNVPWLVDGFGLRRGREIAELIFEIWDLADAHVAQSVERVLGKDEVISSILIMGSSQLRDEG